MGKGGSQKLRACDMSVADSLRCSSAPTASIGGSRSCARPFPACDTRDTSNPDQHGVLPSSPLHPLTLHPSSPPKPSTPPPLPPTPTLRPWQTWAPGCGRCQTCPGGGEGEGGWWRWWG